MTRPGAPLTSLFGKAMRQLGEVPSKETDSRAMEAALDVLARRGTREATMDDVAAESGISRATLFRRYGGKDQLFELALAYLLSSLLDELAQRYSPMTDPATQTADSFVAVLTLFDRLLVHDADPQRRSELVAALSDGDPSPVSWAFHAVRANISRAQEQGTLPAGDPDAQADVLVHLMLGYLAAPSLSIDLKDTEAVRRLARSTIVSVMYPRS